MNLSLTIESLRSYHVASLAPAMTLEVVGGIALVRRWDLVGKRAALLLSRMMRSPRECRKVEVGLEFDILSCLALG
jgi:hypothetical protein